jgi:hypothetical protein
MLTTKMHRKVDSRKTAKDSGYIHIVSLPWKSQSSSFWNESCADVIEVFGLPGGRFTSHATMDHMDFYFKSKRDAELCQVLLSEKI